MVRMKKYGWLALVGVSFCGFLIPPNTQGATRSRLSTTARTTQWHGLTVDSAGVLEKDGYPYHGIGVNFVSALRRLLVNPNDPSIPRDFRELRAYHIPFVRFPALAAWGTPAQCRKYIVKVYAGNPGRYFSAMDRLCAIAEKNRVGLIPSLFFTFWPDALAHEHGLAVWTNPKSRTYRIWTQYTTQMIKRYEHNPAIWGWEFGNEFNLAMDLPNAKTQFPGYKPSWDYTHAQMWKVYARFVHLVRQYDPYHIVEAGNSRPYRSSWHNMVDHTWKKDTPAQWAYMLKMDNAAFDVICVHEYGTCAPKNIARAAVLAARWHKPLYVGEFGASGPPAKSRKLFTALLDEILQAKVPLASVWSFDERSQTGGNNDNSITPDNGRSFML